MAGAAEKPACALFLEADALPDAAALQRNIEAGLAENFHYTHCRRLGQLSGARIFQVRANGLSPQAVFEREMLSRGIKLGNIKMAALDRQSGWETHFSGQFVG